MATYFPPNLTPQLVCPESPWFVSDGLFDRTLKITGNPHRKCEVLPADLEWDFVHRYFEASKPKGKAIKAIYYLNNSVLTNAFVGSIRAMSSESKKAAFKPDWMSDNLRQDVIKRCEQIMSSYPTVKVPYNNGRSVKCEGAYLLPLWHGATLDKCESIAETGFAVFGQSAKGTTDPGYFGKGIYLTDSADYAAKYNSSYLLLSWTSMRKPYPVIGDNTFPNQSADMKKLYGSVKFSNSNAHFVPVCLAIPGTNEYYPHPPKHKPEWDEFVFFEKAQVLPCFAVELMDEKQSPIPWGLLLKTVNGLKTVNEFKALLEKLIKHKEIQKHQVVQELLSRKFEVLDKKYNASEKIPSLEEPFYKAADQLLDGDKVRNTAVKNLLELQKKVSSIWTLTKKDQYISNKNLYSYLAIGAASAAVALAVLYIVEKSGHRATLKAHQDLQELAEELLEALWSNKTDKAS